MFAVKAASADVELSSGGDLSGQERGRFKARMAAPAPLAKAPHWLAQSVAQSLGSRGHISLTEQNRCHRWG